MHNKLSDVIAEMGFNLSMIAIDKGQAQKSIEQLKENPDLAKQVLEEVKKLKPGQKLAVTAAMSPLVKTILMGLMTLAPAAFADEGGLDSLVNMLKNPSKINIEQVNKIQEKSQGSQAQTQQGELKQMAKGTKPGATLSTPQMISLKGVKFSPANQGQAGLAQKAVKMLNDMGQAGASPQEVQQQAQAFAKIIQGIR
jgi:hypothetical protein